MSFHFLEDVLPDSVSKSVPKAKLFLEYYCLELLRPEWVNSDMFQRLQG